VTREVVVVDVASLTCWKIEILFWRTLVLPNEKNMARNALEHFSQVDTAFLLELNHCFAFPNNEKWKRWRCTTSWVTPRMVIVLQISKKCWRWALTSSEALSHNGLCYTILMRAGLSLKLPSSTFVSSPALTLLLDGAEKSLMHFWPAICAGSCGSGDPWNLSTISRDVRFKRSWWKNLDRDFLIRDSGSEW
jgi:hypothetical protein